MKKKATTLTESLEIFELARLKEKYEGLGYNFQSNVRRKFNGQQVFFDALAKHPESKEEIIFEVKAQSLQRRTFNSDIISRRDLCKRIFPHAKFILVLAREREEPKIDKSILDGLLFDFIVREYLDFLHKKISNLTKLERVDELSLEKISFNDFENISVHGFANLRCWTTIESETFKGEAFSDGVPFHFKIILLANSNWTRHNNSQLYSISKNSTIEFDLSEYETIATRFRL
jgi:hypothetical protein